MDATTQREFEEQLRRRSEQRRAELPLTGPWARMLDELDAQAEAETWLAEGRETADLGDDTVFIAIQDVGDRMLPVNDDGVLSTFPTFEEADKAKGPLGVVAAETPYGVRITCKAHGLRLPRNGRRGNLMGGG